MKVDVYCPPAHDLPHLRLKILSPSPRLILMKEDARITITSCSLPLPDDPSEVSDRSEVDTQITNRWVSAIMQVEKDDLMVDKSPGPFKRRKSETPASAVRAQSSAKASKGTNHKNSEILPEPGSGSDPWLPPSPDESVSVPGELVLAKEKRSKTLYYPAKVIGYEAPQSPKKLPLYIVKFMDNVVASIPRDCFYICEQEEFGTCKVCD